MPAVCVESVVVDEFDVLCCAIEVAPLNVQAGRQARERRSRRSSLYSHNTTICSYEHVEIGMGLWMGSSKGCRRSKGVQRTVRDGSSLQKCRGGTRFPHGGTDPPSWKDLPNEACLDFVETTSSSTAR